MIVTPIERLQALVEQHGSQRGAARVLGISAPHMNDLLHGRRNPGPRILKLLGLERITETTVVYVEVG